MVKLSNVLISVLILGLFSLGFMSFLSVGANEYSVPGYTNSTLEDFYTDAQAVETIAIDSKDALENAGANSGNFDIFGGFFSNVWAALKTTWNSMDTLTKMSGDAVASMNFINSGFSTQLASVLATMIIIIFVVAIFFHFVSKSDRL